MCITIFTRGWGTHLSVVVFCVDIIKYEYEVYVCVCDNR